MVYLTGFPPILRLSLRLSRGGYRLFSISWLTVWFWLDGLDPEPVQLACFVSGTIELEGWMVPIIGSIRPFRV